MSNVELYDIFAPLFVNLLACFLAVAAIFAAILFGLLAFLDGPHGWMLRSHDS